MFSIRPGMREAVRRTTQSAISESAFCLDAGRLGSMVARERRLFCRIVSAHTFDTRPDLGLYRSRVRMRMSAGRGLGIEGRDR